MSKLVLLPNEVVCHFLGWSATCGKWQTLEGRVTSAWSAQTLTSVRATCTRLPCRKSPWSAAVVSSTAQVRTFGPLQTGTLCLCVVKLGSTLNVGTMRQKHDTLQFQAGFWWPSAGHSMAQSLATASTFQVNILLIARSGGPGIMPAYK